MILILYLIMIPFIVYGIGYLISIWFRICAKDLEHNITIEYRIWKNGETDEFSDIYWEHKITLQREAINVFRQPFKGEFKVLIKMFKYLWLTRERKIFEEFKKINLPKEVKTSYKYKLFKNKMNVLPLHELEDIVISRSWTEDLEIV